MFDNQYKMMCFNPGTAGNYGFHKIKTIMRFHVESGAIQNPEVIQLGFRGKRKYSATLS